MHLTDKSLVISHQDVHLPFQLADSAKFTVEFHVEPVSNNAIILGMLFLYKFNPSIDWK